MAKKKMDLLTKMMIGGGISFVLLLILLPIQLHYLGQAFEKAAPEIKKSVGEGVSFISSSWNAGKNSNSGDSD